MLNHIILKKKLDMLISNVHKNKKIYLKKLSNVQEKLWKITQPNLKLIKNIFLNSKINF